LARQHGINTVSVKRTLDKDGVFSLPTREKIEAVIEETKPTAMVVIPYDNPTGQYFSQEQMDELGELAVKYDLWLISDEAYRELHYLEAKASSIWGISEGKVPGITGRRIGLETASKVFNGCGLRIGAIVSDNEGFFESAQAVATAELCANAIGQWAYGALAHESRDELQRWFGQQREYYRKIMSETVIKLRQVLPGVIVSQPSASIYSVVDMRDLDPAFDASEFVKFCAQTGRVDVNGRAMTLLVTPMDGFYSVKANEPNPGKTQMRLAYVEKPEIMELVPEIFAKLYDSYRNVSHQT
jgi:aspartate aminotransferase